MHFSKPILLLTLLASSGIDAVMSKSSEDSAEKVSSNQLPVILKCNAYIHINHR